MAPQTRLEFFKSVVQSVLDIGLSSPTQQWPQLTIQGLSGEAEI
jgi:hypothetical protein